MEWTDLLSSQSIIALVLVGVLFAVAMIVVLVRGKFRIKTVKVKSPLLPFEIETEPQKEEEEKKPTTAPRPTRTAQEAEAKDGGHLSKIGQSAPAGTASTQRVSAEGENSEASDIRQIIQ